MYGIQTHCSRLDIPPGITQISKPVRELAQRYFRLTFTVKITHINRWQTALNTGQEFMDTQAFEQAKTAINEDRTSGASQLARQCLAIMADCCREPDMDDTTLLLTQLNQRAEQLAALRPSMAPISNLLTRWRQQLNGASPNNIDALCSTAISLAEQLITDSQNAVGQAAGVAADHLGGKYYPHHPQPEFNCNVTL